MNFYREWAVKTAENAVQLAVEAKLLQEHGHIARAYYLAHMSAEESSKAIVLAASCKIGVSESELPKITRLLRDHKKKISFAVRVASESSQELADELTLHGAALVDHINDLKNSTMYTSHSGGQVVTPIDRIKAVDVRLHVTLAVHWSQWATTLSSAC